MLSLQWKLPDGTGAGGMPAASMSMPLKNARSLPLLSGDEKNERVVLRDKVLTKNTLTLTLIPNPNPNP
jgi:hypothetical protein